MRKEKLNAKYVLYVLLILEALDLRVRKLLLIIDNEHLTVKRFYLFVADHMALRSVLPRFLVMCLKHQIIS